LSGVYSGAPGDWIRGHLVGEQPRQERLLAGPRRRRTPPASTTSRRATPTEEVTNPTGWRSRPTRSRRGAST